MCAPGTDADKLVVMVDIPGPLKAAIDAGMKKIGYDCLKQNAEVVLQVFEDMCVQHVVNNQISDKQLRKLLQRNPTWERDNPKADKTLAPKSRIARSSLIGQDPCGDKVLPSLEKRKSSSTDGDEERSGEADDEGDDEVDYTSLQLLLLAIQDAPEAHTLPIH